jgi:hypothetical protein
MQEAIAALKAGDRARAFSLMRQYLVTNPKDANGWLWMSEVAPELRQQIDALHRVLLLAPDHPRAAAIRLRLRELHASTQPQAAILDNPAPSLPKAPPASPSQPSRSLNDIDTLLARIRGELAVQNVAEPAVRTGEVRAVRSATPFTTPEHEHEVQAFLNSTSSIPATLSKPEARRQRYAEQYSVAVEPRPITAPQPTIPPGAAESTEEAAAPVEPVRARSGGPLPGWAWGALLFLILVLAAAVFVAMSARGLL